MIDKLKIGVVDYTVEVVNDLHTFGGDWKKTGLLGHIIFQNAVIKINQDMTPQMQVITLIHEAIHGILNNAGIDEHDEQMVIALGFGMYALIKDNPELVKAIVE